MAKKYIIHCNHHDCERSIEYGGASKSMLRDVFNNDKLVATAYAALQSGWRLKHLPDGGGFMLCPDHV